MQRPEVERVLRRAFMRALAGFDLASRVKRALDGNPARRVVAVGKAATSMLAGAFRPSQEALLIVPDGTTIGWSAPSTRILLSAHPLPTRRSIEAAEAALAFVGRGDVVVLLSGGASSLMALPITGMDLADKRAAVDQLLRAGVSVRDINVVRRHMSRIKGGRLGAAAAGRVLTIIASDVIGGGPADVGSGPTVIDPTTVADARAVLDRVGLSVPLEESVKADHPRAQALEHRFIARPEDFAAAMKQALEDEGLTVFDMPPTEDDVESLSRAYAGLAQPLAAGQALVRAAEPTVRVTTPGGRGGRSSHLTALAAPLLPEGVGLLCAATDGVDGSSGAAGAVVTRTSFRGADVARAVRTFDTAPLHAAAGTQLASRGPSGLNLCDVHVLARL